MEHNCKRFLSLLLALVMVIGLMPMGHAHAAEETLLVIGDKVTSVEENATYVICLAGTMNALTNEQGSGDWGTHTLATAACGGIAAAKNTWTLESAEGGYKLKNENGYLTISRNTGALDETGHVFELVYHENAGWAIKSLNSNEYFNNLGNSGSIGGWSGDGTKFDLREVVETPIEEADPFGKLRGFWTKVSVDTETIYNEKEGNFEYAWDNNPGTHWHSNWRGATDKLTGENTFSGVIDFGQAYLINQFSFTPRVDQASGQVTQASLYVKATEEAEWNLVAEHATFDANKDKKDINFEAQEVRYVKFVAEQSSDGWVTVSEFDINYDAPEHEHSYEAVVTEPTCTEGGYTTYTCECGDSYVADEVEALGHTAGEPLYTYSNNNDDMHRKIVFCETCGEIMSDVEEYCTGGQATCVNPATCEYCGLNYGETLDAHELTVPYTGTIESDGEWDHIYTWTAEEDTKLTFTFSEGLRWRIQRGDDDYYSDYVTEYPFILEVKAGDVVNVNPRVYHEGTFTWSVDFAECEHDYSKVVTEPTCEDDGYTTYTCELCGATYTDDVVEALGHTEEIIPAVEATCTESGLTEGKKCSVCGEILVAQEIVDALGHTEEIIPAVAATCTESGLTEGKKCSVCGEILVAQEIVDALGHTEETIPAVAATCTESGLTEGKKCSVCGEILVAQEIVEALGHTEEIIPAVEATCTESGLTEGVKCSVCGEILVAQEVVEALGHNYENGACTRCDEPNPEHAVTVIASGWSGYTTWELTSNGVLTVSPTEERWNGKCNMANYHKINGVLTLPWGEHAALITTVVIEEGVNAVGQMAFYELPNLTTVILPESIEEVRNYAFKNVTTLVDINLEVVEFIREGAFYGCSALEDVTFAAGVMIEDWAFTKTPVVLP